MKNNVAILSSGDHDADELALWRFQQNDERIQAGMCPNGCGGMITKDEHNAECLRCGFAYFSSGGLNFQTDGKAS